MSVCYVVDIVTIFVVNGTIHISPYIKFLEVGVFFFLFFPHPKLCLPTTLYIPVYIIQWGVTNSYLTSIFFHFTRRFIILLIKWPNMFGLRLCAIAKEHAKSVWFVSPTKWWKQTSYLFAKQIPTTTFLP